MSKYSHTLWRLLLLSLLLQISCSTSSSDDETETIDNLPEGASEPKKVGNPYEFGGTSALHAAVLLDDIKLVKALLDQGLDVNARDDKKETPLLHAVVRDNKAIAKLLINNGADVNARDGFGFPLLYTAAVFKNKAIVKLLINNGADANLKANNGKTPLEAAGNKSIKRLIQKAQRK